MSSFPRSLEDRFIGCLLGLAVGDALGANFEGQSGDSITARYPTARDLIQNPPAGEQWYTDDTQMAIGIAETLVADSDAALGLSRQQSTHELHDIAGLCRIATLLVHNVPHKVEADRSFEELVGAAFGILGGQSECRKWNDD